MSQLNEIVKVSISRETQSIAKAGFGVPAIISEFSTSKTTETFDRHRFYSSLTEMSDDGWDVYDLEYKCAQKIFNQNPKVNQIMIGRWDSGDANLTATLDAIQIAEQNWYGVILIPTKIAYVEFDIDFVTGNNIDIVINGITVPTVPFNTDQQTTMGDIETAIEAAVANSTVTIGGTPYRTMTIEITDTTPSSISIVVTGGASQPVATIGYDTTDINDNIKECAAWVETQQKIHFYDSSDSDIYGSGDTDIFSFMQSNSYDRTINCFHLTGGPSNQTPQYFDGGWIGEGFPYDPGSQTWAYKTIAGVASYNLNTTQRTNILGKNGNIYTECAGVAITRDGKVASGEYIDIIRGIDWLQSRLQEEIFSNLINVRKIPYTDGGVTIITNIIEGVLNEAAGQGILIKETIEVNAPLVEDIAQTDKIDRLLPDITFTANLQGAIHKTEIDGIVTV